VDGVYHTTLEVSSVMTASQPQLTKNMHSTAPSGALDRTAEWKQNKAHRQPTRHCSSVAMPLMNSIVPIISLMATQSCPTHSTDDMTRGNTSRLLNTVM